MVSQHYFKSPTYYASTDIHALGYRNSEITFLIYQLNAIECKNWSETWIQILTDLGKLPNLGTPISLPEIWDKNIHLPGLPCSFNDNSGKTFPMLHAHNGVIIFYN